MSKLVSFDGLPQDILESFYQSVEPMDVAVGAIASRLAKPFVLGQIVNRVVPASDPAKPNALVDFLNRPDVKNLLAAGVLGVGLFVAQGGSKRARGHVVGALGIEAVDFAGQKLAGMMPSATHGYVEYGMLTRDNAYGMLTRDAAYGNWPETREPTPYDLAALAEESELDARAGGEIDVDVEYA